MIKRRNTPTKEAVLNVLKKEGKAMSQDLIEQKISIDINRATIYRVLNRFCDDGVLHRIVAKDGKQYFALCTNNMKLVENHLHFMCLKCETLVCLPAKVNFSIPDTYVVENVNCVVSGTCKECS